MVTFFRIMLLIFLILTFIMIFADVDVRIKKLYIFLWALIAMIFTTSGVVMQHLTRITLYDIVLLLTQIDVGLRYQGLSIYPKFSSNFLHQFKSGAYTSLSLRMFCFFEQGLCCAIGLCFVSVRLALFCVIQSATPNFGDEFVYNFVFKFDFWVGN